MTSDKLNGRGVGDSNKLLARGYRSPDSLQCGSANFKVFAEEANGS